MRILINALFFVLATKSGFAAVGVGSATTPGTFAHQSGGAVREAGPEVVLEVSDTFVGVGIAPSLRTDDDTSGGFSFMLQVNGAALRVNMGRFDPDDVQGTKIIQPVMLMARECAANVRFYNVMKSDFKLWIGFKNYQKHEHVGKVLTIKPTASAGVAAQHYTTFRCEVLPK